MKHEVQEATEGLVVALDGDVDLQSSPDARRVLLDAVDQGKPVFVDLSRVSYIDSSGVASLVESLQRARKGGTPFALVAVSDPALRVLRLARLDKVFAVHANLEDALSNEP